MILGVMQPYFFPYIGYYQLINAVDTFVIYDDVNYIKGGWINRNRILIHGSPHYITLELIASSSFKKINEIRTGANREKILRTIHTCYRQAPNFNEAYALLERIFKQETQDLAAFLTQSLMEITGYLKMDTRILLSSTLEKNNALKGQEKIVHICGLLSADTYINAIGGKELYSTEVFKESGVQLKFIQTDPIVYDQSSGVFQPNLSIIDVLMHNDPDQVKALLDRYQLV